MGTHSMGTHSMGTHSMGTGGTSKFKHIQDEEWVALWHSPAIKVLQNAERMAQEGVLHTQLL